MRVFTLGRFVLERDGLALNGFASAHRRPLELLALIIASGGVDVPILEMAEALWPDSDGDKASRALTTAIHRLRALIGHDALSLRAGRLAIDARQCWVDAIEFAACAGTASGLSAEERALELYRGPFLVGEQAHPGIVSARERLHGLYVRQVEQSAHVHEASGNLDRAIALYERGLELDDTCETLCRHLMRCLQEKGRLSEAAAAYRRCRAALAAVPGLPPAPQTEAQYQALLAESEDSLTLPESPTLAVLKFDSLDEPGSSGWAALAFADTLLTRLARLPGLIVIDARTAAPVGLSDDASRQAGRKLGARYLLGGSVQRAGQRLRVNAQLVDAPNQQVVWAERFAGTLRDAFAAQDVIVDQILLAMQVKLTEGEQARTFWRDTTTDVRAWELAVQGLELFRRRTPEGLREARRLWQAALELDPNYVAALVPLGWTYIAVNRREETNDLSADLQRAEALARRALALDPHSGPARTLLAYVWIYQDLHDDAIPLLREAVQMNPGGADTTHIVGCGLSYCGLQDEGLTYVRRSMRMAPSYPAWYLGSLGQCLYLSERHIPALEALQAEPLVRGLIWVRLVSIACHVALGQMGAAKEAVQGLRSAAPDFTLRSGLKRLLPLRDSELLHRLVRRLRSAGCP